MSFSCCKDCDSICRENETSTSWSLVQESETDNSQATMAAVFIYTMLLLPVIIPVIGFFLVDLITQTVNGF